MTDRAWQHMLVITRQIKAGRSLASWGQDRLAEEAGVAVSTIRRLESRDGPLLANIKTIYKIRDALERAGVEFVGSPFPGVLLHDSVCNTALLDHARGREEEKGISPINLQI